MDTVPPVVTISTTGATTNKATQTIAGHVTSTEATPGATVTLYDNGTQVGTATVGGDGSWSSSVSLSEGSNSIVAKDTDAAGNTGASSAVVFTLDTVPPVVTISTTGATTNKATQTIAGHVTSTEATPGATVTLYDNGTQVGTATVGSDGSWSSSVSLSEGSNSIVAKDTDAAGNTGASGAVVFTLDTIAPAVTISTTGSLTNQVKQTIAGHVTSTEATPGATVTLYDNGTQVGTATVGSDGSWSTSVALSEGSNSIVAKDTDAAGNTGASSAVVFTLDTVPPAVTISTTGSLTNQAKQTIAGHVTSTEATPGATVTLYDNGTQVGTATVGSDGSWSTSVALSEGSNSIVAKDTDAAGNTGTSAPVAFTLDTIPPTVTIGTTGGTTSQATQTISGTVTTTEAAPGGTVVLIDTLNGVATQIGTATVNADGSWSTSVTLAGSGANDVVAKDTDAAGNVGASVPVTFNLTVTPGGWGNPAGGSWTTAANWSSGSVPSPTSNVVFGPIGAKAAYVASIASSTAIDINSLTLDDPNVTLLDDGALTIAGSLVQTSGALDIGANGSLSLAGASSLLVDFVGSSGSLILDSFTGFTGTIDAVSTATGPVNIGGPGGVTTTSGDAIDLVGSGGTPANPAGLSVSPTGAVTGADTGIKVVQNGYGGVAVSTSAAVIGETGAGIIAEDTNSADSSGVTVDASGNVGGVTNGILALTSGKGTVAVLTGADVSVSGHGPAIQVVSYGAGDASVVTSSGDVITSDTTAINVSNQATAIAQAAASTVTVTAYGTINSGALPNTSGTEPAGILAGYRGGTSNTVNPNVFGSVTITNYADITAAGGDGIRGYDYGTGSISITDEANTTIIAPGEFGIRAINYGSGSDTVRTSAGDSITSGASGISAINEATSISSAGSSVNVIANGSITIGTNLNPSGSQPQGISAGYYGANGAINNAIQGTVSVDNNANITAHAGWAIDAFNYGTGSVTVTDEAGTSVSGAQYGIGAYSNGTSSGGVTVNVLGNATITAGSLYGLWGIQASTNNASNVSVTTSTGDVIDSGGTGINANSAATSAPSTSKISITAQGTINSGYDMGPGGGQPGGIWAGYNGGGNAVNTAIAGNVIVDSFAAIDAAAGAGIGMYNFGVGSVTATVESSSSITAPLWGITAFAQGGGGVTIANMGTITSASGVGIAVGTGTGLGPSTAGTGTISITNSGTVTAIGAQNAAVVQINNSSTQPATLVNSGSLTAALYDDGSSLSLAISDYYGGVDANAGAISIDNSGIISGNVSLNTAPPPAIPASTFDNHAGGTWNVRGQNFLNGAATIINSGTINMAAASGLFGGSSLTVENSGVINVAAAASAFIGGAVTDTNPGTSTGTFHIGHDASLEFAGTVASGQMVSFDNNEGLLILDNPSGFGGKIAGLAAGDIIELHNGTMTGASLSGSSLTVTQSGGPSLHFTVAGTLTQDTFSVLSGNVLVLAPTPITPLSGSLGAQSVSATSAQTIALNGATISSSTAAGLNISASDSNSADTILTEIDPNSSISVTGANTGLNVTTAGANIAIVNLGSIASSGGTGLFASAGTGSAAIFDTGNVTGTLAIEAASTGTGLVSVNVESTNTPTGQTTIDATTSAGIVALTTAGSANVTTGQGVTIDSAASGILVYNQGTSVPSANGSSLSVEAAGTIVSGQVNNGYFAGIAAGYLGGASAPSSIPSPPLSGIFGDVTIDSSATITADSGVGINAFTYGTGQIAVSNSGSITATLANNTSGSGRAQYGITATNYGGDTTGANDRAGNVTVVNSGTITSGSTGITASNVAVGSQTSVLGTVTSPITVTVVSQGAITSGVSLANGGNAPAGIIASIDPNNTSGYNQYVHGDVLVDASGSIDALAGNGIRAANHGQGDVSVNIGYGATITALNTPTGASGNLSPYGVGAYAYGAGHLTVTTSNNDLIQSGSTGIDVSNEATAIASSANAVVAVNAFGTINAGNVQTNTGNTPAGISAGYLGGTSIAANLNVNGSVVINNDATVTVAGGRGLNAYNYGNGDVTVNDAGNVTVNGDDILANSTATSGTQAAEYGIEASADGSGVGDIAINIYSGAAIKATSTDSSITNPIYGVYATSTNSGNISIITSSGSSITSSGVGINAVNVAPAIDPSAKSAIVVTSYSTINSGAVLTGTGTQPAGIIAGYLGGSSLPTQFPLTGISGDVTVNNFGNITAAAGDGIRAYTYGIGDVTVNEDAGTITALGGSSPTNGFGDGINVNNRGSGSILVTTGAGVSINSGSSGISALNEAPSTGSFAVPSTSEITVVAHGTIASGTIATTSGDPAAGILAGYNPGVSQTNPVDAIDGNVAGNVLIDDYASIKAAAGTDGIRGFNYGTGSVTIVTETGATIAGGRYGIGGFAYDGGTVSITNNATVSGTSAAIDAQATGKGTVSIDNHGTINGAVVASSQTTTTFHNESGATWNATGTSAFTGSSQLINDGSVNVTGGSAVMLGGLSESITGSISVDSTSSLEIGAAGGAAAGSITIDSGVTATLAGTLASTTFADHGTVNVAADSFLTIEGVLSGSGAIDVMRDASVGVGSVLGGTALDIVLEGAASALWLSSASLDSTLHFTPVIGGLSHGNAILYQGLPAETVTSVSYGNGELTLFAGSTAVAHLALSGDYQGASFYAEAVQPGETQIGILAGGDSATAPVGTTTADNYVWNGGIEGSWDAAANWLDTSTGQYLAPGSHDNVTINSPDPLATGLSDVITGVGESASLTMEGGVALAGQFTTGNLVIGGGPVENIIELTSGASLSVTGTVTATSYSMIGSDHGSLTIDGNITADLFLNAMNGSHVVLAGGVNLAGTSEIEVDATSSVEIGTGGTAAAGSVTIDAGASVTLSGGIIATDIVDNGTILFSGNMATTAGLLGGTGQIDIASGGNLTVETVAKTAPTIAFEGSGTLTLSGAGLDGTMTFSPVITGFDATDTIAYSGATVTSAFWNAGILTLEDGTTPVAYLHLSGDYSTATFTVTTVNGISQIVDPAGDLQTIADGATLELGATADRVSFAGGTGTLILDQPAHFQGQIDGLSGPADVLTLRGYDATDTTVDAVYDSVNDTTVLTVVEPSDHQSASLILDGNHAATSFGVTADPNGGVDIAEKPAIASIAAGGHLELTGASNATVTFAGGTGSLILDQPSKFTGEIIGFTGTAPDAEHSDTIDLAGINYQSAGFAETYDASTGILAVTDGVHSASFKFSGFNGSFDFASDGRGGTLVTDPPAQSTSAAPPAGNGDQFVFKAFAASGHTEATDHVEPGQFKADRDPAGDSSAEGMPHPQLSGHAAMLEKTLLSDRDPDGQQSHDPLAFLKNVGLASLSANDFVLPHH
ncbi:MAG TPA: Ig-like domain-containing protein [Bradyrhizobium sp.]|nr:Ig-like domain-containing protein [Bradyrhizobium sp.]